MKRLIAKVLVITFTLLLASTVSFAAQKKKPHVGRTDGTITLVQESVAVGIGFSWGSGTLTYKGKKYPFDVNGMSVVSVGVNRAEASGKVFDLRKLSDFNGTYSAVTAEGTVGAGGSATTMRNENGVTINLLAVTKGLSFKLAPEGVTLTLK